MQMRGYKEHYSLFFVSLLIVIITYVHLFGCVCAMYGGQRTTYESQFSCGRDLGLKLSQTQVVLFGGKYLHPLGHFANLSHCNYFVSFQFQLENNVGVRVY